MTPSNYSPVDSSDNFKAISETILGDYYIQEYYKMLEYGIVSLCLCSILGLLAYIFSLSSIKDTEQLSEYECGFEPFDSATRLPFDIHFYIVGILFLIFDVEVAVLFPWVLGIKFIGWYGYYTMILFLIILTIGFIYEWQRGALNWPYQKLINNKYILSFFFVNIDNKNVVLSFFDQINNYSAYTTRLDLLSLKGEMFLATLIGLAFIFVSCTGKSLDNNSRKVFTVNINMFSIITLVLTGVLFIEDSSYWTQINPLFSNSLTIDLYSTLIKLVIICSVIFILMNSKYYLISRKQSNPEFPVLILLATLFLIILVSAFNLFTAFMCIIGFSITLYVLILSDVDEHVKREASIKYYYLSVYSSGFLIFGIFLIYLITNSLNYINIKVFLYNLMNAIDYNLLNISNSQSILILLVIALMSILIGILFKLSAFPCHFWAPEIYDGSPNIVAAYFILPVKIAVFAFFLRLFSYVFGEISCLWQAPLLFVSIASMIWGCLCAVNELKIKRFIAYTSINQMGFLLIGIVCNSFLGYQASLIYLFIYIVMNIAFLVVFLNSYNIVSFKALKYFGDFKYLKFTGLTQMFYLTIVIFSMAGIPPFAGFFGKYFLLLEAYNADLLGLVIFALATSLISAYYYIRIIKISFFETTSIDYTVKNFLERLSITTNFNNILNISNINTTAVPLAESFVCVSETDSNLNLPWFASLHKLLNYIYYTGILFLFFFVFIINFMYKISFFSLNNIFWMSTTDFLITIIIKHRNLLTLFVINWHSVCIYKYTIKCSIIIQINTKLNRIKIA